MNFCIFEGHGKEGIARREGTALVRLLLATTSELPQWDATSNTDHECRQQNVMTMLKISQSDLIGMFFSMFLA